jgi:hypothetical protein
VARPTHDHIGGVVSHEGHHLFVGHVVRQRFAWIDGRSMDEQEFAAIFERQPHVGWKMADSLHHEFTEGLANMAEKLEALAVIVAPRR